jgi:hypothetical protein
MSKPLLISFLRNELDRKVVHPGLVGPWKSRLSQWAVKISEQ